MPSTLKSVSVELLERLRADDSAVPRDLVDLRQQLMMEQFASGAAIAADEAASLLSLDREILRELQQRVSAARKEILGAQLAAAARQNYSGGSSGHAMFLDQTR